MMKMQVKRKEKKGLKKERGLVQPFQERSGRLEREREIFSMHIKIGRRGPHCARPEKRERGERCNSLGVLTWTVPTNHRSSA